MHSKGKVKKVYSLAFSIEGEFCENKPDDIARFEALWNAADGITTAEAVKYLKHGREMVERLRHHCNLCESRLLDGEFPDNFGKITPEELGCLPCPTYTILAKLDKEEA